MRSLDNFMKKFAEQLKVPMENFPKQFPEEFPKKIQRGIPKEIHGRLEYPWRTFGKKPKGISDGNS